LGLEQGRAEVRAFVALLAFVAFSPAWGETLLLRGYATTLSDGDTFALVLPDHTQHRIRPAGADAPERGQPYWRASRAYLAQQLDGQIVEAQCYKKDRDGRDVCRVFVGNHDVSLALVRQGYAWHFKRFAKEQTDVERLDYAQAESEARALRLGLWQDPNPEPPWENRSRKRTARFGPR
jgi:endonuclease YncB( thermonuclease family)